MPHRGIESDVENYRRNRRCRWNHFLCGNEEWSRTRKIVVATDAAGGPFSFEATKNGIGRGRLSSQQTLQAGHSSLQQRKLVSDAAGRCRYGRSRRAILHRHDDCAASIRKSGLEIKNRCTKEGENREKLTSIRKSGPEIKNRCTQ